MPSFAVTRLTTTPELTVIRAECDGRDAPRVEDEAVGSHRLWMLTAGCFELRDATRREVVDPSRLLVLRGGREVQIRHPCGADTCVAFRGALVDTLVEGAGDALAPAPRAHVRLLAATAAWRRGAGDELEIAEALCAAAAPEARTPARGVRGTPAPSRAERALAARIAHDVRVRFADAQSLGEVAARAGVSVFHAAHVFRRVTGAGIHAFRRELRLRHALALVLDTGAPLARIAADCGFASQSHLTNRFRERFGRAPGMLRYGSSCG